MKKKSGQRILSLLMALILVIGTLQVPGLTIKVHATTVASGKCGISVDWELDDKGTLTISGSGKIDTYPTIAWSSYIEDIKKVVIGEGVDDIGFNAFKDCVNMTEITLPDSLLEIGSDVFEGCKKLTNITIPQNVDYIEGDKLGLCEALVSIGVDSNNSAFTSENGVLFNKDKTWINMYPLAKTDSSYTIPDTVTGINPKAFYGCSKLNSITIPDTVEVIGSRAFYGCKNLSQITLPSNDEFYYLNRYVFYECSALTSVTVPGNVTEIGESAFGECTALKSVVLEEGVNTIGSDAFNDCTSLEEIIIPKSIKNICKDAFKNCSKLDVITYMGSMSDWNLVNRDDGDTFWDNVTILYNGGETVLDNGNCGTDGSVQYTLYGNGVLTISGTGAVTSHPWNNSDIRKVVIGSGVTDVTAAGFINCILLEDISVEDGNTEYSSADGILFNKNKTELIQYPCNKDGDEYTVPDSVTVIGDDAFVLSSKLTKIVLPDNVTSIGKDAFSKCSVLENINIPNSVTVLEPATFFKCTSLEDVTVPDAVTDIKDKAFAGCSKLKSITFSDSVTSIEEDAFNNCSSLTDVYYGGAGTKWNTLQSNIAANNSSLTNAKIHYMKGSCGSNAAWTLTKDGVLTISGTGKIEKVAGDSWKSADVKEVLIGNGVTTIGDNLFSGCEMTSVTIPEGVITIEDFAFASCDALTDVVISGNTITIRGYGFAECTSLESITIPKNVVIEESAFLSCVALKDVYYGGTEDDWNDDTLVSIDPNENDMFMTAMIHYTVSVTGVSVTPTTLELRVGESGTLTAMVAPEDATNKKVNWTSSKPEVATVADGVVTAVAEGESIITVTTSDGEKTATCKVTVAGIPVTGVSIAPETLSLKIGGSGTIAATVSPENATNKNVSWTSSTPEVATVADGVVTAVAEGESIITVTTEDGAKKATCKVTVSSKDINVSEVSITPETLSLKIGESGTLTATVSPENATNKKLNWTSSAEAVATVADGVVTAVAEGESIITVTSEDGGKTATCNVTVTKAEEVVDPEDPEKTSEPKIPEGPLGPEKPDLSRYTASGNEMAVKSINLKKTLFKDVKGIKKFNVTAGDASAVKIKGGTLMVLKDATVTIEAVDKKKEKLAEKTITVIAPAIDSAQTTEINRRGTLDLNKYILSTVQPSGWKSSNKNVAAVSENGLLIIKKSGTVKLTATFPAEKGMTAKKLTIKLKVKMPQFKKTTYTLKTGKTIKTAVKNADEAGITYRTEDTAIATVDATGSVTGVSKGTTKLIMTVKGIDYETKIKVK